MTLVFAVLSLISVYTVQAIQPNSYCGVSPSESHSTFRFHPGFGREANMLLVHLSVFIRHGDRLPAAHKSRDYACWPNAPEWNCDMVHQERPTQNIGYTPRLYQVQFLENRNLNPGNCGQGRLTRKGYNQQIHNGRMLRDLYITQMNFLPFSFNANDFYFRATNVPRTQLSAESLLLGLYNTTGNPFDACSTEIFQINTVDTELDNMYPNPGTCPTLNIIQNSWRSSNTFQTFSQEVLSPLAQQLSTVFNIPVAQLDVESFFDCLEAHVCHQMPLPADLTQEIFDTTVYSSTYIYSGLQSTLSSKNSSWAAIAIGDFVAEYISLLDQIISGKSQIKMALYSGHDTTLMPLLAAYGVWDGVWPAYASVLRLHILQDSDGNFFVELIYNDGTPLVLPGCTALCPYSTFRSISANIMRAANECQYGEKNAVEFFMKDAGIPPGV